MKKEILNLIYKYKKIIIHRHCYPDLDALGSQVGLATLIKENYPYKKVFVAGKEDHKLSFISQMDEVYKSDYSGALVIICDTNNQANIDDKRYKLGEFLIKIDHHPDDEPYGDISWINENSSSTSEMIYELYEYGKDAGCDLNLTDRAAYLLYAGIIGDTGRFMYQNTTKKTLSIGSKLLAYTFSTDELFDELYKTELRIARLKGYILQHFQLTRSGVGFIKLEAITLAKLGVTSAEAYQLINTFSNVENIELWCFFIEESDGINVRLRSNSIAVNFIAKEFGGGGHFYSAGMAINNWKQADIVLSKLEASCSDYEKIVL